MMPFPRLALGAFLALALGAQAQTSTGSPTESAAKEHTPLTGELFYQLLLGELNARGGEPGAAFSLLLDAARKTNDAKLYQRAADIALQARSGESALQAARAWKQAQPTSREGNRYVLQILIALNRTAETAEPLKTEISLASASERVLALLAIPRHYARSADKKLAASVVEQALSESLASPAHGAAAWTAVGRMRVLAGDPTGAIEAAHRAQAIDAQAEGPALLALELMDPKVPLAEPLVRKYLEVGQPLAEVRMGYARVLLETQRYAEASQQLQIVTRQKPDFAEAWLVQGTLQLQDNQYEPAEASLQRYIKLAEEQRQGDERSRGLAQAYLSLAQIAEKRKDYPGAEAWLNKIDNAQDLVGAQNRRASLLAKQGKMAEARQLLRGLPERNPGDARMKLMAEVQLLRDNKQYRDAYDLLSSATAGDPKDTDLLYDQAMLAEKLGSLGEMERLLRQLIEAKPDYHHAYNALGYSLAERNVRLPEAKQLIQKALEFAPGDPFITDSLGWVEFRMGNKAEALRVLDGAYKSKPDAEIAAHLGEVLWSMGQRDRAMAIWREGLLLNAENETLQETLKRLRVKL
ncbi:MAG TPA: tetratricopeptide repeat protein [Burkholderiaceae bacterium]|nr:tetratricopeptide repeat protein [Burkholderiaceae bacterium]